jgi:hypothetical protein
VRKSRTRVVGHRGCELDSLDDPAATSSLVEEESGRTTDVEQLPGATMPSEQSQPRSCIRSVVSLLSDVVGIALTAELAALVCEVGRPVDGVQLFRGGKVSSEEHAANLALQDVIAVLLPPEVMPPVDRGSTNVAVQSV